MPVPPEHRLCWGCMDMMLFLKRNGRLMLITASVVIFCFAISSLFGGGSVLPAGSWGLSFRTEGQAPIGNANAAALAKYDAAYVGGDQEPVIYLTFDAGFENGCTAQILDVLQLHGVPAAFFLTGNYLEQQPELVQRMADEGHIVGNHTWHHYDMSRIADPDAFRQELQSVEEAYRAATGREMPKYYRPPQGVYSEDNLKMAQELGYRTVFWSLAYVDWYQDQQPTKAEAFSKLIPRIHPGAVVLLHSTSTTNAAILDELLCRWKDLGYSFGSLDDLFSQ